MNRTHSVRCTVECSCPSLTSVRLIEGDNGRFSWSDVFPEINPSDSHYARTSLVSVEDTCNRGGGSVWTMDGLQEIREGCTSVGMPLHLDGARVWNALIARNNNELPALGVLLRMVLNILLQDERRIL